MVADYIFKKRKCFSVEIRVHATDIIIFSQDMMTI